MAGFSKCGRFEGFSEVEGNVGDGVAAGVDGDGGVVVVGIEEGIREKVGIAGGPSGNEAPAAPLDGIADDLAHEGGRIDVAGGLVASYLGSLGARLVNELD